MPPPGPSLGRVALRHHEHVVEHERGPAEQLGQLRDHAHELQPHGVLGDGLLGGGGQREQRIEPVGAVGIGRHQIDQPGDRMGAPAGQRPDEQAHEPVALRGAELAPVPPPDEAEQGRIVPALTRLYVRGERDREQIAQQVARAPGRRCGSCGRVEHRDRLGERLGAAGEPGVAHAGIDPWQVGRAGADARGCAQRAGQLERGVSAILGARYRCFVQDARGSSGAPR